MLLNAIEHGNLGISFEKKGELLNCGTWKEEVQRRLSDPENGRKQVHITVSLDDEAIILTVSDQGNGFDWEYYMNREVQEISGRHGRGIAMAKMISFDAINYTDDGKTAVCITRGRGATPNLPESEADGVRVKRVI